MNFDVDGTHLGTESRVATLANGEIEHTENQEEEMTTTASTANELFNTESKEAWKSSSLRHEGSEVQSPEITKFRALKKNADVTLSNISVEFPMTHMGRTPDHMRIFAKVSVDGSIIPPGKVQLRLHVAELFNWQGLVSALGKSMRTCLA